MPKLTAEEREQAKQALIQKVEGAIDSAPRGLTVGEIRECILKACAKAGLINLERG